MAIIKSVDVVIGGLISNGGEKVFQVVLRSLIIYTATMVSIRLMGRRQIGELQPSEFAITIIISNIATISIEDLDIPLAFGIVPMVIIVIIDVLVSYVGLKNRNFRKLVSGKPKVIISNGVIDQVQLKKLRYTIDDIMESLRGQGIFDLSEVQLAIVETTGKISFYQKYRSRNVTNEDLNLSRVTTNPPALIVSDGILLDLALKSVNLSKEWLSERLKQEKLQVEDVFIMTADPTGKVFICPKDK